MREIAEGVAALTMTIANAYLVGDAASWALVDAGSPGNAGKIRQAAQARFGNGARPRAIILTHGHFDHAGSADSLARMWSVPVYAHRMEMPYLTGRSSYPPLDPTGPGFFSAMSRLFPSSTVNLSGMVQPFDSGETLPGLENWEMHATPGHTPGHVAFFRRADGVLLAGDAVTTMNLDRLGDTLFRRREVSRPPAPATYDWEQARSSVERLAALRPRVIAAGHGLPMQYAADQLERLAANFPAPAHGRYVAAPARFDENGITYLPPAPPDPLPAIAAGFAAGLVAGAIAVKLASRGKP
jgi:glyoxylase-like metal-dependent hydrolase (beta-lactamase superfamily II)